MGAVFAVVLALQTPLPSHPTDDLRALMAHPETPSIGLVWRDGLRGVIGARVPILREEDYDGFGFYLAAFAELHNEPTSDQILPNENWRAYVALDFNWRRRFQTGRLRQLDLTFSIEHESDHWTGREDGGIGQLNLNDVRIRASMLFPIGRSAFVVGAETRTYIASCSQEPRCGDFSGNTTFAGAIDILWDLEAGNESFEGWSFFTALHGSAIAPAGKMSGEARVVMHLGGRHTSRLGQWQLYGLLWYGNAVGIDRSDVDFHAGGGFRHTF